jgi:hypothetical protein
MGSGGVGLHTGEVGESNLQSLESGGSLETVDDLELLVERSTVILTTSSLRAAAGRLQMDHSAVSRWLKQRQLVFPSRRT